MPNPLTPIEQYVANCRATDPKFEEHWPYWKLRLNFREWRCLLGVNQRALASAVGLTGPGVISGFETGKQNPSINKLIKTLDFLGLELMIIKKDPTPPPTVDNPPAFYRYPPTAT